MSLRTINSPDVEIKEKDFSQIGATIQGDTFVINGFFAKGPDLEPTELTSVGELNAIFGKPTNEAERYSYEAATQALLNGTSVLICKIPYENDMAGNYKVVSLNVGDEVAVATGALEYALGVEGVLPITLDDGVITETQYDQILAGEEFNTVFASGATTKFADDDFVIVGDSKDVMELDDKSGIFVTMTDFVEGLAVQNYLEADPTLNGITFTGSDFNFGNGDTIKSVSGALSKSSISEDIMLQFPTIDTDTDGLVKEDKRDYVSIVVGKTFVDSDNEGKIGVSILEAFTGSLDINSKNQVTGESDYIVSNVNAGSSYIKMIRNTNSGFSVTAPSSTQVYKKATAITVAPTLSFIADAANGGAASEIEKDIILSTITSGLDTVFAKLANFNEYVFNYIVDAGLSTIAMHADNAITTPGSHGYEPATDYKEITSTSTVESWKTIVSSMVEFCERTYKFAMALVDVPRDLAISGDLKILRKTNPTATFATAIASKLKYLGGVNSTYGMAYTDWTKRIDSVSGTTYWCPETVEAIAAHAYTHQTADIFDAPAGLRRGVMTGVIDIAFNPSEKEASRLYTKGFNYAKRRPDGSYTVEGQKMWTSVESALNRANVRYMFLVLERYAYDSSQKFVYQPNNQFTRTQFKDILEAPLKRLKNVEGVYDYAVVCDSTNNTDETIAQNEMRAFVGISPTRTAEYIVITFAAVPLGADIEEYVKYS
jgi:hypothetical protein